MTDPVLLVEPVITAIVAFIKMRSVQNAAGKATGFVLSKSTDFISDKATESTFEKGRKAFEMLRSRFLAQGDVKAEQALETLEQHPDDKVSQQTLVQETARLASTDPSFAQELQIFANNVVIAQSGSIHVNEHTHIESLTIHQAAPPSDPWNTYKYMAIRGPEAHRDFTNRPLGPWDTQTIGVETIENVRAKLLRGVTLEHPVQITVKGALFPCALLTSGWWDRGFNMGVKKVQWRNKVQEWLFHGFDLWGPSWDFTWDIDNWEESRTRNCFIAQLGDGDEANSLSVLIPNSKAQRLRESLQQWGGIVEAEITCLLGHRKHFKEHFDSNLMELFGGLLDYCLWINEEDKAHKIKVKKRQLTDVYSGYLWKCLAAKQRLINDRPKLEDVYFVWEHTNLSSPDAVAYGLEALEQKEAYIKRKFEDDLVLVQKSSSLVPGTPLWKPQDVYAMLLDDVDEI